MVRLRILVPAARARIPRAEFVRANGERFEHFLLPPMIGWDSQRVLVTPPPGTVWS